MASPEVFVYYYADERDTIYGHQTAQQFSDLNDALGWINLYAYPNNLVVAQVTQDDVDVPPPWDLPSEYQPSVPAGFDMIDGGTT